MNGTVKSVAFSPDSKHMYSYGGQNYTILCIIVTSSSSFRCSVVSSYISALMSMTNDCWLSPSLPHSPLDGGKVYVWDLSARECIHVFDDDGTIHGSTVVCSPNGEHIICGSVGMLWLCSIIQLLLSYCIGCAKRVFIFKCDLIIIW